MAKAIILTYSENFRENKIASEVYGRLRDRGFNAHGVSLGHTTSIGETTTRYIFSSEEALPERSQLERMLNGIKYKSLDIEE